jgi:Lrp/AsnC family leucine-responsive transcriptional regulator
LISEKYSANFKNSAIFASWTKSTENLPAVLQADARTSLQDMSQAVGLSPSPCWGRIRKMEEAGIIEGYTVRLNPQALGLNETVLVQITLDSHSDNTLEKLAKPWPRFPR